VHVTSNQSEVVRLNSATATDPTQEAQVEQLLTELEEEKQQQLQLEDDILAESGFSNKRLNAVSEKDNQS